MAQILTYIVNSDHNLERWILTWRSGGLDSLFFILTFLGYWLTIVFLSIIVSFLFKKYQKTFLIRPFLVSVLGTGLLTVAIKFIIDRARPIGDIPLYVERLPSFPSAHAALIFVFLGFLIYCIARFSWPPLTKVLLITFFLVVILGVGFSRLYLGVHFLSDVLGGYLVGLLWVLIAMYLTRKSFN